MSKPSQLDLALSIAMRFRKQVRAAFKEAHKAMRESDCGPFSEFKIRRTVLISVARKVLDIEQRREFDLSKELTP